MTIVDQLVDDHAFFYEKFKELEALSSDPDKEQTVLQASALVQGFSERHRLHLKRESSVLFPALLGYLKRGKGTGPGLRSPIICGMSIWAWNTTSRLWSRTL